MKITISDLETINGRIVVYFSSYVGDGVGTWVGRNDPVTNNEYDAEIDIEHPIDNIFNVINENVSRLAISRKDNSNLLKGKVESIDDDGMAYFRLSKDCLIMIETGKSKVKTGEWISLVVHRDELEIYTQGN